MAPFRDCFMGSEVVAEIEARADREPLIGSDVPFVSRARQLQAQPISDKPATKLRASRVPAARGGDPTTDEASSARVRAVADRRAGGAGVLPPASGGRRYRVGRKGGRQ